MLKKFFAKFGKGAATVDLRFENRPYFAGETVNGEVHIIGGEVEQKINSLAVRLMMSIMTKQGTVNRQVTVIPLSGSQIILPKEQKVIPFTYQIPANIPVSRGAISYYFDTQLDIDGGVDRTDVDRLIIEVSQPVQSIFHALSNLGFREKHNSGKLDQYGQEFAFFPTGLFASKLNEVELRFALEESGVRVWMEADCRNGFQEFEAKREFFLDESVLNNEQLLAETLKQYLTEAVENPHLYAQPFSFASYHPHHGHHGSGLGGMVGGLAMGIFGGMLLDELMEAFGSDELIEEAAEAIGFDEEMQEEVEDLGFGDFFGGDDEGF
jgi:sporulation-control protein